ncbi:MAG TPA: hypothetical protein VEC11_08465 [Allosphingosinicella sp.]|nr:hypothetical protein [Allosphingosinicella sp.]
MSNGDESEDFLAQEVAKLKADLVRFVLYEARAAGGEASDQALKKEIAAKIEEAVTKAVAARFDAAGSGVMYRIKQAEQKAEQLAKAAGDHFESVEARIAEIDGSLAVIREAIVVVASAAAAAAGQEFVPPKPADPRQSGGQKTGASASAGNQGNSSAGSGSRHAALVNPAPTALEEKLGPRTITGFLKRRKKLLIIVGSILAILTTLFLLGLPPFGGGSEDPPASVIQDTQMIDLGDKLEAAEDALDNAIGMIDRQGDPGGRRVTQLEGDTPTGLAVTLREVRERTDDLHSFIGEPGVQRRFQQGNASRAFAQLTLDLRDTRMTLEAAIAALPGLSADPLAGRDNSQAALPAAPAENTPTLTQLRDSLTKMKQAMANLAGALRGRGAS